MIMQTFVHPIIDYPYICFDSSASRLVEQLLRKETEICRRALQLNRFHTSGDVCELAEVSPIDVRLELLHSSFVNKAVEQNQSATLGILWQLKGKLLSHTFYIPRTYRTYSTIPYCPYSKPDTANTLHTILHP